MWNVADLREAVLHGAVQRIRPKIMTGLRPSWPAWCPSCSLTARRRHMKRIAAPMVGGVVTSAVLELVLYPIIYSIWRERSFTGSNRHRLADG